MIRIAMGQMLAGVDKVANIAEIARLSRAAVAEGADLVVLPEYSMYYKKRFDAEYKINSESLDGQFVRALIEISRDNTIAIVAGMIESIPTENLVFNTVLVVDAKGELVNFYRKMHLYDAFGFRESDYIKPGAVQEPVTFQISDMKLGLLTCYDLRFPEPARIHADAGVEALIYPAAWIPGQTKLDHWNTLAKARAIENTMYVVAVSQPPPVGVGSSVTFDPMGVIIADAGEETGIAMAELDSERVKAVRETNPSLRNRRFTVTGRRWDPPTPAPK